MHVRLPKWIARYAAIIWTIGIFAATLMPSSQVPSPGIDWPIDKVVHFTLFLGFGVLWMRGLYVRFPKRLVTVIISGVAVAILTEVLQGALPFGRTADIADIAANIAGLVAGVTLFHLWFHRNKQPA